MRRGSPKNRILDYWLGVPVLNLLATLAGRRRPELQPGGGIRRLGVMCSPALGDTLLFSAVLADLRAHMDAVAPGQVEIVHLCMRSNLAAAEIIPGADRQLVIDLTRPATTLRALRSERLDAVLDFSAWQRLTAFYTLAAGAPATAGFRTPGQHRGRGYGLSVEHRNDRHELDNFRSLLHALGVPTRAEPQVVVPPPPPGEPGPLAEQPDVVALHLWASGQRAALREWPEERWVELAERLARPETVFAVTGAPSDLPRTEPFVARLRAGGLQAIAFTGADGFRSLARMLSRARLLVSVNTGVMHLAAIAGTPTLSLNGPTNALRWGPMGPRVRNVDAPGVGCGYLHLGFDFSKDPPDCMGRITVDQVVAAAQSLGVA